MIPKKSKDVDTSRLESSFMKTCRVINLVKTLGQWIRNSTDGYLLTWYILKIKKYIYNISNKM